MPASHYAKVDESKVDQIERLVDKHDIELVRFLYCDTSGIIRGKTTHTDRLAARLKSGIGLVKGMMAMNLLDQLQPETGLGASGEVRLVPDVDTFTALPYAAGQALLLCDLVELDYSPWVLCPRSILIKQLARAKALGISLEAAFEPEFVLASQDSAGQLSPIDESLCFSTQGMNSALGFIMPFVDQLSRQGVQVEQYYPELGHGQNELSIAHAPALRACDNQIIYRETLRAVAQQQGLVASVAPKPFVDQAGNGCHLHLSAWDRDPSRNLFYDIDGKNNFSVFGRQFVAGILQHLPALVAITCPSVNSYRRLQLKSWSSAYTCWGFENREAAVRVPSLYWNQEEATCNIEIKCVDGSCNPYLALAAVIAAGLDGVERKLEAPEPIDVEPSTLTETMRQKNRIARLPTSLMDALILLEKDSYLMKALGEQMIRTFMIVKSSEVSAFAASDTNFELKHHRTKF